MPRASSLAFRGPSGPYNVKTTPGHPGKPFEVELSNRYTVLTAVGEHETLGAVQTEVQPAERFWAAEDYHQQYLQKGGQSAKKRAEETIHCYG